MTGGFAGLCGSFLLGPRIGRFDEDEDYKNTKKKLQMLSKERASKKTKFGKKYRHLQKKKDTKNNKTNPDGNNQGEKKNQKKGKHKKVIERVRKNGDESFGSDDNVDD